MKEKLETSKAGGKYGSKEVPKSKVLKRNRTPRTKLKLSGKLKKEINYNKKINSDSILIKF